MRRTCESELPTSAATLRRELSTRNLQRCEQHTYELSYSRTPAVLYTEDEQQQHGNFYPPAYRRILANADWRERLQKAYTASVRVPHRHARIRRELDTATSSDALLMSIFCAPGTLRSKRLRSLLSIGAAATVRFGTRTRLTLAGGHDDRTEIDLELASPEDRTFFEAKLTETGFQRARRELLARYPNFENVFEPDALARNGKGEYLAYQLIRLVLAAHHHDARLTILADARRPDLHEHAFRTFAAVRTSALRSRLHLVTWQELAACLSRPLQHFLSEKYGIFAK